MKLAPLVIVGAIAASTLTGCTTEQTCFDWVDYQSVDDAGRDAQLVIVGNSAEVERTADFYGAEANVYQVAVGDIISGNFSEDAIDVVSTPATCTANGPYPDGDPLAVAGTYELFLHHDENGMWRLITPYDGVVPLMPNGLPLWDPSANVK